MNRGWVDRCYETVINPDIQHTELPDTFTLFAIPIPTLTELGTRS